MTEETAPVVETTPAPRAPAPTPAHTGFSPEYVKDLREENKGWRLKASEQEQRARAAEEAAAAAKKLAEDAEKAVADRLKSERETADKGWADRLVRAELKAAAVKAGMIDLDGLKLADLSAVKLNDDGEVEGADDLLAALKEAKPYLFTAPANPQGGNTNPANPPKKTGNEPKLAKDMTDAERKAFLAEHQRKFGR